MNKSKKTLNAMLFKSEMEVSGTLEPMIKPIVAAQNAVFLDLLILLSLREHTCFPQKSAFFFYS